MFLWRKIRVLTLLCSTPFNTSKGHRYRVYTNIIKKLYDFNYKKNQDLEFYL